MLPIFKSRKDQLKTYLEGELKNFMFTELSDSFLDSAKLSFMKGVPVPIRAEDLKVFTNSGLSTTQIADNMAVVIGADTHFKYVNEYLKYLNKLFDDKLTMVFAGMGEKLLQKEEYRKAMCYLRAAMLFRQDKMEAMFCYANGCRYWYLSMEGEDDCDDLITILKKESLTYLEYCTSMYPLFPQAWYFLGYAYLNQGQYLRAQIAWKHYISCCENDSNGEGGDNPENIKEIKDRLAELEDPVQIEKGVNLLGAGRMEEGLKILEPYVNTQYGGWWPLHFNLACAYQELGYREEAIEGFLKVLDLSPSNADAMDALARLYEEKGDTEKAEKYKNKAKIVRN